jgi:glycosyltransferase involved in cell wall biosynthesis
MSRPRVLFFSPRFPWPLDRGDRLRAYHLLRGFARHADVTLFTLTDTPVNEAPLEPLLELCARVEVISIPRWMSRAQMLGALPGRLPFQVAYFRSEAMERLVDRANAEAFDLVVGQMFRVFPYMARVRQAPRVMDLCDSLAMNYRGAAPLKPLLARLAFREEWRRVEAYEAHVMDNVTESWVVSEVDRQDLLRRRPAARIAVVPNGVEERWGDAGLIEASDPRVLFLGNLTVGHNVDAVLHFVEAVWPRVRQAVPTARLDLAGLAGPRIRALDGVSGVHVHGFVPDLRELLESCRLSVAPVRYGAGIQNKVIETIAAGLPAVVTSLVSRPLGCTEGREILVADEPVEQARAVVALLTDEARRRAISRAGQTFVRARFSWRHVEERAAALLADL